MMIATQSQRSQSSKRLHKQFIGTSVRLLSCVSFEWLSTLLLFYAMVRDWCMEGRGKKGVCVNSLGALPSRTALRCAAQA